MCVSVHYTLFRVCTEINELKNKYLKLHDNENLAASYNLRILQLFHIVMGIVGWTICVVDS